MAKKKSIIMSWSKCKVEVGKTGDNDAMATDLKSVGTCDGRWGKPYRNGDGRRYCRTRGGRARYNHHDQS